MADGKKELEEAADKTRKAKVDKANKKAAKDALKLAEANADKPLSKAEKAFVKKIAPKMNCGRTCDKPSPADITKYARLLSRVNVKADPPTAPPTD